VTKPLIGAVRPESSIVNRVQGMHTCVRLGISQGEGHMSRAASQRRVTLFLHMYIGTDNQPVSILMGPKGVRRGTVRVSVRGRAMHKSCLQSYIYSTECMLHSLICASG
jgi:hypothetical protein